MAEQPQPPPTPTPTPQPSPLPAPVRKGLIYPCQKGNAFRRIDAISRDHQLRDAFLDALKDQTQNFVDVLSAFKVAPDAQHTEHLRRHWFPQDWMDPNSQTWWKELQPIEPIIREGYIYAFEQAKERQLPIDGYWISASTTVAVCVSWNDAQINLLRLTPSPPGAPYGAPEYNPGLTHEEELVIIQRPRVSPVRITRVQAYPLR